MTTRRLHCFRWTRNEPNSVRLQAKQPETDRRLANVGGPQDRAIRVAAHAATCATPCPRTYATVAA